MRCASAARAARYLIIGGLGLAACASPPPPPPRPAISTPPHAPSQPAHPKAAHFGETTPACAGEKNIATCEDECAQEFTRSCVRAGDFISASKKPEDLKRAMRLYARACIFDDQDACAGLGEAMTELGVKDARLMLRMFARACDRSSARACQDLGERWVLGGAGVQADWKLGGLAWERACELGDARSCGARGRLFLGLVPGNDGFHRTPQEDLASATPFLVKGCKGGDGPACRTLLFLRLTNNVSLSYDEVRAVARAGCALPSADACYELGEDFAHFSEARPEAFEALEKACEFGGVAGCVRAAAFVDSHAPDKDVKTTKLLERACALSAAECYRYDDRLLNGLGVARDEAKASRDLTEKCTVGDTKACIVASRWLSRDDPGADVRQGLALANALAIFATTRAA